LAVEAIRLEQPRQLPHHKALACKVRALLLTAVAVEVELVGHPQLEEAVAVEVGHRTRTARDLPE
jgi:hypothetical protein